MVVAVDDGATWALAASVAVVGESCRTCHLLPRCWATAKAPGLPAPAAVAEILGSTRSRTTTGIGAKGRAAADHTVQMKKLLCHWRGIMITRLLAT